jgi:DNA invertase Pin-like site-specific DNA recombinase
MTDAVGYTRLSQDGMSIPKQKEKIREYSNRHNLNLIEILDDGEHSSGYETDERPEYRKLREMVRNAEIDAVVVRDTGRIGRDFDERMYFVLDCRQAGIELHSHESGQHDLTNPWAVLQETAQAAGDDVQKRKEIERSKEATKKRLENGCYHGTPPLGLQFAEDNCHLEKHQEQWSTLCEIIEARENGTKVETVANEKDVSTATVSRISNRGLEWYQEKLEQYGT